MNWLDDLLDILRFFAFCAIVIVMAWGWMVMQ